MKPTTILIITLTIGILILIGFNVYDKVIIPYIQEQQQLGFEEGIYQTALDQTQNSRVFYITQNNTLDVIGIEELCGVGG